jgi:hypothetical protein
MIDIQKVETFLCAAENLSLSSAARQLHLSQPAISHQIKALEEELNTTLFIVYIVSIMFAPWHIQTRCSASTHVDSGSDIFG